MLRVATLCYAAAALLLRKQLRTTDNYKECNEIRRILFLLLKKVIYKRKSLKKPRTFET